MTAPAHLEALVSPAWHPAREPGDGDPLLSDAKAYLGRKFSYGRAEGLGTVDVDDTYTEGYGRAQAKFKSAVRSLVQAGQRLGPITDLDSEFDWATKKQMGFLAPPPPVTIPGNKMKPLFISVEGHMSNWDAGPTIFLADSLKAEGLVDVQGTTYENKSIPFRSDTGVNVMTDFFLDPMKMPPGRRPVISGFSEGEIVTCRFLNRHVINPAGMFHHRLDDIIAYLPMGAPTRPLNFMGSAMLQPDPPAAGTAGIAPEDQWLQAAALGDRVAYLCRHGDMYTEVKMDKPGKLMRSVYKVVAQSDPAELFMELLAAGINPTAEVLDIAYAIIRGTLFVFNMQPHGGYELGPATNWVRDKVRAAVQV